MSASRLDRQDYDRLCADPAFREAAGAQGATPDIRINVNQGMDAAFADAHTGTPEDLSRREAGSRQKLENAFRQFLAVPTTDRGKLVMMLMDDYQGNWMQGRKRVTVQD
jgi:hypothetical protein